MNIPENLKYSADHEWIRVEDGDIAYVGITDFAQHELGDIVFVDITTEGETLEKGEVFGGHLNKAVVSATCEMIINIIDGRVDKETLKTICKSENWLNNKLIEYGYYQKDILYAFYRNKRLFVIKK